MASTENVQVKRIYDDVSESDGARVLVDRLWPRGVSKERADLYEWLKNVAPSTELRKWYNHDPEKFPQFQKKYEAELQEKPASDAYKTLQSLAKEGTLTLLTASKAVDISEAEVLKNLLTA